MLLESATKTLRGLRIAALFFMGELPDLRSSSLFAQKQDTTHHFTLAREVKPYHPVNTRKFDREILGGLLELNSKTTG